MKIIKSGTITEDDWQLIREPDNSALPEGKLIVPFSFWQENQNLMSKRDAGIGIWIDGSVDVEDIVRYLDQFSIIALDFPAFTDGRCYSHARLLRERYKYSGELRAIGDVLQDQLFYMQRCGFNSFQLREDKDYKDALNALKDFSVTYQAASDEPLPIYKRR